MDTPSKNKDIEIKLVTVTRFPGNDLPYLDAGSPSNQQASGSGYDWSIQSVFGRIRYNYKEKYLFETTVRDDGSSRFPTSQKYGMFPSFAAGWRISEESFVKDNYSWITNMKLKASWEKTRKSNILEIILGSRHTSLAETMFLVVPLFQELL